MSCILETYPPQGFHGFGIWIEIKNYSTYVSSFAMNIVDFFAANKNIRTIVSTMVRLTFLFLTHTHIIVRTKTNVFVRNQPYFPSILSNYHPMNIVQYSSSNFIVT
jgi:hypothetical protein